MNEFRELVNNKVKDVSIPLLVTFSLLVGILLGIAVSSYQFPKDNVQLASKKYSSILSLIDREYVDSVQVEKLFKESIQNVLSGLDPHSSYVEAEDYMAKTVLDADFEGIGIRYYYLRDTLFVTESIIGGPSHKAGLKDGDRILMAGDSSLIGIKDVNVIYRTLRGTSGSDVALKVYRKAELDTVSVIVTRGKIPNMAADLAFMINSEVGYIRLNRFSKSCNLELVKQMNELLDSDMSKLILDLRNNGGGYLNEAKEICDLFLEQGRDILFTVNRGKVIGVEKAEKRGGFESLPIIILLNENSASASEIVAGALQDNDRALIVGRRSFGKGLVQTPFHLLDGSELRLTTSRYHTPSGRCIQKPYTLEGFDYSEDYLSRIKSGELFSEEYIKKYDSLKYHTTNMRTVYGGGGIYPDVFVPEDTMSNSILLRKLYSEQIFTEFGILYGIKNEKKLQNWDLTSFLIDFKVNNEIVTECLNFANQHGITVSSADYNKSLGKIKLEIKAHIAESKWGILGMNSVLSKEDNFILKSIEVFPTIQSVLEPAS